MTSPVKNWAIEGNKVSFYFVIPELDRMGGIIIVGTITGTITEAQLLEQSQVFEAEGVHGKEIEPITPEDFENGGYIVASEASPLDEAHGEEPKLVDPRADFESTDVPEGTTIH